MDSPTLRDAAEDPVVLTAMPLAGADLVPIVPAPNGRAWISGEFGKAARKCLPLLMANQAGWFLLCPVTLHVSWNGDAGRNCLSVTYEGGARPARVQCR